MTESATTPPGPTIPPLTWRLVIVLSIPALAQQGLAFSVLLSDRWLAAHLRVETAQSAVQAAQTTAHYLAWFISCYNILVTVGSTALVARAIGAGDRKLAIAATHQSLILAVIMGVLATTWALLGGIHWMVDLLQLRGEAATYAVAYLMPLFGLLVFQTIEVAGIACLVGAGDTRTGLWVTTGVAILNVPLAWCFGWGIGPFPNLGFVGIAVGTALSHVLGGIVVLIFLMRGRSGLTLELSQLRPRTDLLYRLLRISVPAGFDSLSIVAGQFWFLGIVNTLGNDASSAHGIALLWEGLGYLSGAAFGTAAMTLVGQNLGARRPDHAARAGWMAFALGCGVMSLMGLLFFAFAPPMFAVFTREESIITAGVPALRLIAFAMPPLASTIVFTSALRGAGDTRVPVIFTWVGFFAVRIPLAYYLSLETISFQLPVLFTSHEFGPWQGQGLGLVGCWMAMSADLIIRGIFFLGRFVRGAWKHQHV